MHVDELIAATLRGRNLAEFNRDAGRPVSDARMRDIAKPDAEWKSHLDHETYYGIATAAGVTLDEVMRAACNSIARYKDRAELAMRTEESTLLALMPTGTARLREHQVDAILAHVRSALADADEIENLAQAANNHVPEQAAPAVAGKTTPRRRGPRATT